jgi:hypothetical protein
MRARTRIHGVDWSGAADAGRKIWIASGVVKGGVLCVQECRRALELPESGVSLAQCLPAITNWIVAERESVIGFDFPFGLPRALVAEPSWEAFVRSFPRRYPTADAFRQGCWDASGGREVRRQTDVETRTPFATYNLRLHRQTHAGIGLLGRLVRERLAAVLPMQRADPGVPWLVEICPASTLKNDGVYVPYKGGGAAHRAARERLLGHLERAASIALESDSLRREILADPGGDGLDSVIALVAASRALQRPDLLTGRCRLPYRLEGYVCV